MKPLAWPSVLFGSLAIVGVVGVTEVAIGQATTRSAGAESGGAATPANQPSAASGAATAATTSPESVSWDAEFGNTLYNTPRGWSTTQKTGTIMLVPPDLAGDEGAAIVITPGGELTGDFKSAFDDFRSQLRGDANAKESPMQSATADEGYPVLYVAEQIQDEKNAAQQYRFYVASHPGDRAEFVFLTASSEAAYQRYNNAFQEFVKTVAYKNVRPGAQVTPTTGPTTQPAG